MQEVVDAALLKKVKTSIERNKSLQKLVIHSRHGGVVNAILKRARGNNSLKELIILYSGQVRHKAAAAAAAAAAKLRQVRPQLEFSIY